MLLRKSYAVAAALLKFAAACATILALYEFLLGRQIVPLIELNIDPCIGANDEEPKNDAELQKLRQFLTDNEDQLFYAQLIFNYDVCDLYFDYGSDNKDEIHFDPNGVTKLFLGEDNRFDEVSPYSPLSWGAYLKIDDAKFDQSPFAESTSGDGGGAHLIRGLLYLGNDGDEFTHIYELEPVPFDVQAQRIYQCGRARERLLRKSNISSILSTCLLGL